MDKESYLKLPNITVSKLQDVVDFLDDNDIEYVENGKNDLQQRIDKAVEYIETIKNNTPKSTRKDYAKMILLNYEVLLNILKGDDE